MRKAALRATVLARGGPHAARRVADAVSLLPAKANNAATPVRCSATALTSVKTPPGGTCCAAGSYAAGRQARVRQWACMAYPRDQGAPADIGRTAPMRRCATRDVRRHA